MCHVIWLFDVLPNTLYIIIKTLLPYPRLFPHIKYLMVVDYAIVQFNWLFIAGCLPGFSCSDSGNLTYHFRIFEVKVRKFDPLTETWSDSESEVSESFYNISLSVALLLFPKKNISICNFYSVWRRLGTRSPELQKQLVWQYWSWNVFWTKQDRFQYSFWQLWS